jgi:hypothetical protein
MAIRLIVRISRRATECLEPADDAELTELVEHYGDRVESIEIGGRCNTPLSKSLDGLQIVWAGEGSRKAWGARGYVRYICRGPSLPEVLTARNALREEEVV